MTTIALVCEDGPAVIAVLRPKVLPSMLEHVTVIEEPRERHHPGKPTVWLSLTDDVFLRSDNWARWRLGIPLLVAG